MTAHLDLLGHLDQMVCQGKWDLSDALDSLEDLDVLDHAGLPESQGNLESLDVLDSLEGLDRQDEMESVDMDHQGARDQLDRVDHQDHQERMASAAQMGNRESKGQQEGLEETGAREKTDAQGRPAILVSQVRMLTTAHARHAARSSSSRSIEPLTAVHLFVQLFNNRMPATFFAIAISRNPHQ